MHAVVDCGKPPTVPNGPPGTLTSTTFGGTVFYMCINNRYYIFTCEASGSWSIGPTCLGIIMCNIITLNNLLIASCNDQLQ